MNPICKFICIAAILPIMACKCPAQATLPSDFSVPLPKIPDRTFKISDFGAKADGKTFDTHAFQSAIAACTKAGGGTVDVPPGQYLVTPFVLASNLNLRLEAGAVIRLTPNPDDYNLVDGLYESAITLKDGHDISITGSGTIDGQGARFWKELPLKGTDPMIWQWLPHRPALIMLTNCTNILVQGVTLTNSPMFHLVPMQCKNVTIQGIHVKAPAISPNTDGIDPSGQNFLIENCTIDTGDDCIAVKAGGILDPSHPSCENFLIQNCTFLHGHGMSVGSETSGGLRNMLVRNCSFTGTDAGIRIKSSRNRGGPVENVTYENLTMHNVKNSILITSYYPKIPTDPRQDRARALDRTPSVTHIRITDVTATDSQIAGQIVGLPEMPLEDIILTRVHVSAKKPMQIFHANGVQFIDCRITSTKGVPLIIDSTVQGLAAALPEGSSKP
jgi:polygalacturonase